MSELFISYKAEDRRRVRPLVDALEAEGLSVWWDEHVGGGEAWREKIAEQLEAATCVIVVWSKRSIGPEGRFVRDEANRAQRRGTYLPVTIDAVEPPLGFGEMQALPLAGWRGKRADHRYRAISKCVHSMLGRAPPAVSHRQSGPPVSRRTILAGSSVAVAAAAAGGWYLLSPARAKANTIAVLPFANLSGDPSQDYFSDGIAEELRNALSALGGLNVVARTSSEMLRNADTKTAARKLDVANVITGSVRRSSSTVRVSAQLIEGDSGLDRWSQTFDRPFGDVLQIQTDIANNVAKALSIELGSTLRTALSLGGTRSAEAQDFLLKATESRGRDDGEKGTLATIALLDRAIELDPNYAQAYATKSQYVELWASQFATSVAEKERGQSQASQSARQAIAIAPQMSLGYAALGGIHQDQLELSRALDDFERADSLPGANVVVLAVYALVLSQARRSVYALSTMERAIKLDPLNALAPELQSQLLSNGRRFPEAAEAARRALRLEPERLRSKAFLGNALLMMGRPDQAQREYQQLPTDDYRRLVGEAAIAARNRRRDEALNAIKAIEQRYGDAAFYQFGQIFAQLGLVDQGVAALETAWAKRDPGLAGIQVDPFIDPLRKDPRIARIAARIFG